MHDCLIAFGSNEGDSVAVFKQTLKQLQQCDEISLVASSQPVQTKPIGGPQGQLAYINAAIRVQTSLDPTELHKRLVQIESDMGRERRERWGARKIDLDLLIFAKVILESESLTIPHPRMSFRRFVLEPASEIAGDMIHATSGQTIDQLLELLNSREKIVLLVGTVDQSKRLQRSLPQAELAGWAINIASDVGSFERMKEEAMLVCTFNSDDQRQTELTELANSFAGPTLRLPGELEKSKLEIMAALQAMS